MDVSVNVGYFGPHISNEKNLIKELDEIGISCIWTAEHMDMMRLHHFHILLH